jgi:hypothetical protein
MSDKSNVTIGEYFSTLPDPRQEGKIRHELIDIITIVICAFISGCDEWTEIELYANAKKSWFENFSQIAQGHSIP